MNRKTTPTSSLARLGRALCFVLVGVTTLASSAATTAHARPPTKPSPALFTRSVAPHSGDRLRAPPSWQVDLVIRKDGSVTGRDGRHLATLTPADLRRLNRQIRATRWVLERPGGVMCTGFPNRRTRIQTSVGVVSWASPCAAGPHTSVHQLELLVRELIASRSAPVIPHPELDPEPTLPAPASGPATPLVRYETRSFHSPAGSTSITIFADGTWAKSPTLSHPGLQGALTTQELSDLRRLVAAVSLAPTEAPPACAARLDGHASLAVAGLGEYRWDLPCGRPHRSAQALITHLRALTDGR